MLNTQITTNDEEYPEVIHYSLDISDKERFEIVSHILKEIKQRSDKSQLVSYIFFTLSFLFVLTKGMIAFKRTCLTLL